MVMNKQGHHLPSAYLWAAVTSTSSFRDDDFMGMSQDEMVISWDIFLVFLHFWHFLGVVTPTNPVFTTPQHQRFLWCGLHPIAGNGWNG